jgi:hypothetical protein
MRAVSVVVFSVVAAGVFFASAIVQAHPRPPGTFAQDQLVWPASDDQGLLSDLLKAGFKLPELVLITTKPEAWPLQECAAAAFKQQPTLAWNAKGLSDRADHDLLVQKVSPILVLCSAHLQSWAVPCGDHYQSNVCAMLTVWLVSVQDHCVRTYGRACTAHDTFQAIDAASNSVQARPQSAPAIPGGDLPTSTPSQTTGATDQTIKAHCVSEWPEDFQMRAWCEDQQREGLRALAIGKPDDITQEDFAIVQDHCTKEWPDDFQMRAWCEVQQLKGIRELKRH